MKWGHAPPQQSQPPGNIGWKEDVIYPAPPQQNNQQQQYPSQTTRFLRRDEDFEDDGNPYFRRRPPPPPQRSGWQEFKATLALIAFCASLVVKAVAYANSHWSNSDRVDVYRAMEKFPLTTTFISMPNNVGNHQHLINSECVDQRCKIFFSVYQNQRSINELQRKSPPPLYGTYNRGVNTRCETLETSLSGSDSISTMTSKYEKCAIDKELDINDFKSVRILLIVSMVADGLVGLAWIGTFFINAIFSYAWDIAGRALLIIAVLLGFMSSLITALALGLFAQAVDIINDHSVTLGWPFYIILVASGFTLIATILTGWPLYRCSQSRRKLSGNEQTLNMRGVPGGGTGSAQQFKLSTVGCPIIDESTTTNKPPTKSSEPPNKPFDGNGGNNSGSGNGNGNCGGGSIQEL